jgi:hypothetical protein
MRAVCRGKIKFRKSAFVIDGGRGVCQHPSGPEVRPKHKHIKTRNTKKYENSTIRTSDGQVEAQCKKGTDAPIFLVLRRRCNGDDK